MRPEFIIFALILLGVAIFHRKAMEIALAGLLTLIFFKFIFDDSFHVWSHFIGEHPVVQQLIHKEWREGEWFILLNLFGLLTGFAILAKLFESSRVPEEIPAILPNDWTGGLGLLVIVFLLSSFLDNIAAAMIGGTIATVVYKGKVHTGFLAAIVAASNAGGAGSVLGDTTTTMMWIDGVNPLNVLHAYIACFSAFLVFGTIGSWLQHKFHRIRKDPPKNLKVKYINLFLVILMLLMAILTNVLFDFPALGVWVVITLSSVFISIPWDQVTKAMKGTVFLLSLVAAASLMPVNELPPASASSAFILGFISAIFDNIPLTKLCLDQGGYDWGVLAYTIGFGGSMIWFGSSAGVALSNMYPSLRNTGNYIKQAWHIPIAYVFGFFILLASVGWQPHQPHKPPKTNTLQSPVPSEYINRSK